MEITITKGERDLMIKKSLSQAVAFNRIESGMTDIINCVGGDRGKWNTGSKEAYGLYVAVHLFLLGFDGDLNEMTQELEEKFYSSLGKFSQDEKVETVADEVFYVWKNILVDAIPVT